jgi:hypothetical protein
MEERNLGTLYVSSLLRVCAVDIDLLFIVEGTTGRVGCIIEEVWRFMGTMA